MRLNLWLSACVTVNVCCTAGGVHVSTLMEVVQCGYGAVTKGGIEAELKSLKFEGKGAAGTARDKVSRHGSLTSFGIEMSSHLAPLWSD